MGIWVPLMVSSRAFVCPGVCACLSTHLLWGSSPSWPGALSLPGAWSLTRSGQQFRGAGKLGREDVSLLGSSAYSTISPRSPACGTFPPHPRSKGASQGLSPGGWLPASHGLLRSAAAARHRDPPLCAVAGSRANPFRLIGGQEGWRGQSPMAWGSSDTDLSTPSVGQGRGRERIWSEQAIRALLKRGRLSFLSSGLQVGAHVLRRR